MVGVAGPVGVVGSAVPGGAGRSVAAIGSAVPVGAGVSVAAVGVVGSAVPVWVSGPVAVGVVGSSVPVRVGGPVAAAAVGSVVPVVWVVGGLVTAAGGSLLVLALFLLGWGWDC